MPKFKDILAVLQFIKRSRLIVIEGATICTLNAVIKFFLAEIVKIKA